MEKRVAIVTGSASGLAVQTVFQLAEQGHHIALNYRRSKEKASKLQKQLDETGVKSILIKGDVSNKEDCYRIIEETIDYFGRIDILVNNAGPYIFERKNIVDYEEEVWDLMLQGNLSAVFYLCKKAIPVMRNQGWGRVINFGFNEAGQATSWMDRGPFAAAKVGLVSLTKTMAQEECEYGITVNMICPGDIVGKNKEKTILEVKDNHKNIAPIGRPGAGEDVARIVGFLCAEESDFITGSIIEVNGGLNVQGKRTTKWKSEDIED